MWGSNPIYSSAALSRPAPASSLLPCCSGSRRTCRTRRSAACWCIRAAFLATSGAPGPRREGGRNEGGRREGRMREGGRKRGGGSIGRQRKRGNRLGVSGCLRVAYMFLLMRLLPSLFITQQPTQLIHGSHLRCVFLLFLRRLFVRNLPRGIFHCGIFFVPLSVRREILVAIFARRSIEVLSNEIVLGCNNTVLGCGDTVLGCNDTV